MLETGTIVIIAQTPVAIIKSNTKALREIKIIEKMVRLSMLTEAEAEPMLATQRARLSTKMVSVARRGYCWSCTRPETVCICHLAVR